MGRPQY
ncbi:rCG45079 [Rattus norvegicus]|nr:rCG45079 [Rattus norvegicus]